MSKKTARIKAPRPYPRQRESERGRPGRVMLALAAFGLAALVAAFWVAGRKDENAAPTRALVGQPAPSFSETSLLTGEPVSNETLRGKNVLLFFSEGVMCQACFEQMKALEQSSAELEKRSLTLVMVTNDEAPVMRKAAELYELKSLLVSDEDRTMTAAFDALDQGMHENTAGHTFFLLDRRGVIRWRRDYWLGANPTMYVRPAELFAAIPTVR